MTERTAQTLGLILLTTPLILLGCTSSNNGGGTGGASGGLKYDGAAGTGGTGLDAGNTPEVQPPPVDAIVPPSDATLLPDAPVLIDTLPVRDVNPAVDAPLVDSRPPADDVPADAQSDDANPDGSPLATCTETTKFSGGSVTVDRTLAKACSPYTIKTDVDVNGDATLTIEPGVTVRFNPDTNISVGYSTAARIVAVGTAAAPITLTSSNTTPGAGDWMGVQLWGNTMNGTKFSYVTFDYCGSNGDACLVSASVKANRVAVDHVTFSHVGAGSDAIWQKDKDSNFGISNCTFNDIPSVPTQQYAISVDAQSFAGIDSTNTFNGNAMVQLAGGTIGVDVVWKNVGTVVAVTDDLDIGGAATPKLTIAAGSTFKFAADIGISIGYSNPGSLTLAGTAASRVILTSMAGTPAPGDWNGIILWSGSSAKIQYAIISYAGSTTASSSNGAVSLVSNNDSLDIQNSNISYSGEYGIGVSCGSTAVITNTNNTFTNNTLGNVGPGPDATAVACQ